MTTEITQDEFNALFALYAEETVCPCDLENPTVFHRQSFSNIEASNTRLGCSSFVNCGFYNCRFEGASLDRSTFKLSNFIKVSFNKASLLDCDLSGARMRACSFVNATITGANLGPASVILGVEVTSDLQESDFAHSDLERSNLSRADLRRANLFECSLKGANLSGASLRDANLSGADLTKADLRGADLTGADLRNAKLTGAKLEGAIMDGAKVFLGWTLLDGKTRGILDAHTKWVMSAGKNGKRANLQSAKPFKKDLSFAELSCADLRDADLSHTDLRGAYLTGPDLMGADLREPDLTGADFRSANLSNAQVTPEQLKLAITDNFIAIASNQKKIVVTKLTDPADASPQLSRAC